jgi:hypothetical protein
MTTIEDELLENILDALDRLFDREMYVIDLLALLFATAEALRTTRHYEELLNPTNELREVVRSGATRDAQRDRALHITDKLRHYLADVCKSPEST